MDRFEFPRDQSPELTRFGHELVGVRDEAVRSLRGMARDAADAERGTLMLSWPRILERSGSPALTAEVVAALAPDLVDLTIASLLHALDRGDLSLRGPSGEPMDQFGREQLEGWFLGWRAEKAAEPWNPEYG